MKIKGVIKKNASRNFSEAVVGSVRSIQFQIVPGSSLYVFSRSIGPFQCLVNVSYRFLICCTCHFQSGSFLFVYFGFLCLQVSSVSNFCPDKGGEGGRLFRLTCSVVLWGGTNTANKYCWCVCGVLTVYGPHWVCPQFTAVLSGSTLLRPQGALQGTVQSRLRIACTCQVYAAQVQVLRYSTRAQTRLGKRFVPFPGPSSSGNQVLGERTVIGGLCVLITSSVLATRFPRSAVRALSQCCVSQGCVSPLGS